MWRFLELPQDVEVPQGTLLLENVLYVFQSRLFYSTDFHSLTKCGSCMTWLKYKSLLQHVPCGLLSTLYLHTPFFWVIWFRVFLLSRFCSVVVIVECEDSFF
ncbi:hypothetical protein Droror1_Dr00026533 [Drosera rotundifolia]